MTTRNFVKSLSASIGALFIVKPKLKAEPLIIEFKQQVVEDPLDIQFEFERCGLKFKGFATKNILVPFFDDEGKKQLCTNSYGEYYRIICKVTKDDKHLKVEGNTLLKDEMVSQYKNEIENIVNLALISFNTKSNDNTMLNNVVRI